MEKRKYIYSSFACIFVISILLINFGGQICVRLSGNSFFEDAPFPLDRVIGGDFLCSYYMALRVRYGLPLYEERDYSDPRQAALDAHYIRMLGPLPEGDKRWIVRVQTLPWNHMPFSACLYIPFTWIKQPWAYRVHLGLNIIALFSVVALLGKYSLYRAQYWMVSSSLIALSYPLLFQLERGTSEWFAVLAVTLAFIFWCEDRSSLWIGLCIAIAINIKMYPLIFLYYFFLKREWRICASCIVFTILLMLLTAVISGRGITEGIAQYGNLYRFVKDVYIIDNTWVFAGNHSTYSFLSFLLQGRHLAPVSLLTVSNIVNLALVICVSIALIARQARHIFSLLMDFSLIIVIMTVIPAAANDYSLVFLYFVFCACIIGFENLDFRVLRTKILFIFFSLTAALLFLPTLKMPIIEGPSGGYFTRLWFLSNKWPPLIILAVIVWLIQGRLLRQAASRSRELSGAEVLTPQL